jgi:hypothetical protein
VKFSIVIPLKGTTDELEIVSRTLPSYYAVKPSELVISIDDPPEDERIIPKLESIMKSHHAEELTRILKISVGHGGWNDQQMKARHTGFLKAKYNRILTGDIDLIINKNVLKAVRLVGKNNVGLVSCSKLRIPHGFLSFYRLFSDIFLKKVVRRSARDYDTSGFEGLYAVWKPYWLEVEPVELAKKFSKLKTKVLNEKPVDLIDFRGAGDDTHLRDLMVEKYVCLHLLDIGGMFLTDLWEERPIIQYGKGVYFANQGRKLLASLGRAIIRVQPYYFCGYIHGRRIKDSSKLEFTWSHAMKGGA